MSLDRQQKVLKDRRFVFSDRWLAESVRLALAQHRPSAAIISLQQQSDAEHFAQLQPCGPEQRILWWADSLSRSMDLRHALHSWQQRAWLVLIVMLTLAFAGGLSAALGIMGNSDAPVNVLWALGALLGINFLMLLFWLVSLLMTPGDLSVGKAWFWLSSRFYGSDAAVLAQSFSGLSARMGVTRWWMAAITHSVWSSMAAGAFCGLLLALSLRSYVFVWETTILPDSLFNTLVQGVGWLPAQLGFTLPDETAVTGAGALNSNWQSQADLDRRAWAGWLCGALFVYGLLPRLLLLMLSAWRLSHGLRHCRMEVHSADWSALNARLSPLGESIGVVDPEQASVTSKLSTGLRLSSAQSPPVVIAFELSDQIVWPPAALSSVHLERVASRQERLQVLTVLQNAPPRALLLVCDAAQTVDRGSLSWLTEASGQALHVAVWLAGNGSESRRQLWRQQLQTLGVTADSVFDLESDAFTWLEAHA